MLPNSDCDSIRDHLVNRVEKKISGLKRKVGQIGVAISSQRKVAKRRMEMKAKAEKEPLEAVDSTRLQLESAADGECEDVKSLMNNLNIDYHARRFRHYTGHQSRLAHEQEALNNIIEELKMDPKLIFITADYAMKFLPLKDSEAQNEFFRKAGINWHGLGFLWFCNEEDVFKQYFVNQCAEDSTEDGISVIALLSQVC
jgi:hypothetical protein